MRRPASFLIPLLPLTLLMGIGSPEPQRTAQQGFHCDYMGQAPPGRRPEVFAPGFISTERGEVCFTMSPDGGEICFSRFFGNLPRIMVTRREDGRWTEPLMAPFNEGQYSSQPFFAPDGNALYFCSNRPLPEDWPGPRPLVDSREALKIWRIPRSAEGWGIPRPLDLPAGYLVGDAAITNDGTIVTSGLQCLRRVDERYSPPEQLSPELEGHWPYVTPDGECVIYGHGSPRRLMVSFRREDGTWSSPRSCSDDFGFSGPDMNGTPSLTPDGAYLFFAARHDIWWVDAEVVWELEPKGALKILLLPECGVSDNVLPDRDTGITPSESERVRDRYLYRR